MLYCLRQNGNQADAHAAIGFFFLFYNFYDMAFIPPFVSYSVEIFPYLLRSKGFAFSNFVLPVSFISNQYVRSPFSLGEFTFWIYRVGTIAMINC